MRMPPGPTAGGDAWREARLLVVDDEPTILELLAGSLRYAGFDVVTAASGMEALRAAAASRPDLILLDVMMPDGDGFEIVRQMRSGGAQIPIIFLTARSAVGERVAGLTLGGDDYITKPFSPRELVARVRSVLRGVRQTPLATEVLRLGDLEIDSSSMTVHMQGRNVLTTVREFRLLEYLATHRGRVLTRDQILDAVWKETPFVTPRSIDVYIRRLREKIEADARHPQYLKTLRGIGYRFEVPK
jgi:DNA-binding response OmpR family regulator